MRHNHPPIGPFVSKESLQDGLRRLRKVKHPQPPTEKQNTDSSRYVIRKCESINFEDEATVLSSKHYSTLGSKNELELDFYDS